MGMLFWTPAIFISLFLADKFPVMDDAVWNNIVAVSFFATLLFAKEIAASTLFGLAGGMALGLFFFYFLNRLKLFHFSTGAKTWLQILICIWLIAAMTGLGSAWGLFSGIERGSKEGLRLAFKEEKEIKKLTEMAANWFFLLDQVLGQNPQPKEKLEIKEFLAELGKVKGNVVQNATDQVMEKFLEQNPGLKGKTPEKFIRWLLNLIAIQLLEKELDQSMRDWGLKNILLELELLGKQKGPLTKGDLGDFLTDQVIIPVCLYPLLVWISGVKKFIVVLSLLALAIPIILVQFINLFIKKPVVSLE